MPIKPENKPKYPADWPQVRQRILTRAGWCCEHPGCLARQYAMGKWLRLTGNEPTWQFFELDRAIHYSAAKALAAEQWHAQGEEGVRPIVIVLTIGHLDHQPENCADDNLRAWCQRHHLAHDALHHQQTAYATRKARACTADLFLSL